MTRIHFKDIQFIPNQRTFLVFQFIRFGPMCPGNKVRKEDPPYRRPKGVSVLEITSSIIENHESERQVGIQLLVLIIGFKYLHNLY